MDARTYSAIAEDIAADIAAGRLKPGDRLLPQREFAYRRGIAASTAARVYEVLHRRGLIVGEVGRGTFVRSTPGAGDDALSGPAATPVDLELNYAILPGQAETIAASLARLLAVEPLAAALAPTGGSAPEAQRTLIARHLARAGWSPAPETLVLAGNGRQAVAAALAALVPPGCRVGVEAQTYPVMLGIARHLGIDIVPIEIDAEGMVPDKLAAAHRAAPLKAVYLQPHLHNPLGLSMGPQRRRDMAETLRNLDLAAIEDAIYGFLVEEPPLAALAPERILVVDSFSKRVVPGITLGVVCAPPSHLAAVQKAIRAGAWGHGGFAAAAIVQLVADGVAGRLEADKRRDARARQRLARDLLSGCDLVGDPRAYHLMLMLPGHWRAEEFVAAAARLGISTVGARAFAAAGGQAPNGVRLALASAPIDRLKTALACLRELALSPPEPRDVG
jgi:DNA-binding transcriptional MocR family regulator